MAGATARELVRFMRGARPMFLKIVEAIGCECIQGFGIGLKRVAGKRTKDPCIIFFVTRKLALRNLPWHNRIPAEIHVPDERASGGVIQVVTDVQAAQFQALAYDSEKRPCVGGYSIGHPEVTAGTLGCLVLDKTHQRPVILSNNHILANANQATIGDPVLQPGPYDGGMYPSHAIATLERFEPIDFTQGAENLVDAAIATPYEPVSDYVVSKIEDVGSNVPTETRNLTAEDVGESVKKTGRTTQHTTGTVVAVNTTVTVKYSMIEKATFVDQIIIESELPQDDISAAGDSGSAVLDQNNAIVGLLFAASQRDEANNEPATAIINPIKHVFSRLNLDTLNKIAEKDFLDFINDACKEDSRLATDFLEQFNKKGIGAEDLHRFLQKKGYGGVSLEDCEKLIEVRANTDLIDHPGLRKAY